ncbi:MAG: hypothetical protein ACREDQ_00945, partial [Limisphaerales bacterium]
SAGAASQAESVPQPLEDIRPGIARRISRRLVLLLTFAAAGLLIFCYTDMGHNIKYLSPAELRDLINQSTPGELRVNILVEHYRSLWHESPDTYQSFDVEVRKDGKTARYVANVGGATVALLAQKGIACRTYVAGRDFEILGTPGRMLPVLAAFVLAISVIFLLKRRHPAVSATR